MNFIIEERIKKQINEILEKDGVIAFVTDTVWGIGCLPSKEKAVEKIYEIKGRDRSKPLILMSSDFKNLERYVEEDIPLKVRSLKEKYLPGALTIVLKKSKENTPDYITSGMSTVGLRVPDNIVFRSICELIKDKVLATTSANLSNQASSKNYKEVIKMLGDKVDLIIDDYGYKAKGLESTVVKVNQDNTIEVLRNGAINIRD